MKQLCLHSLTPKICLLILPSSCYTFPCTFVIRICCQVKIITFSLLFSWMLYGCSREKLQYQTRLSFGSVNSNQNGQPIIRYNIRQGSPQVGETLPSEMQKNSPMPKVAQNVAELNWNRPTSDPNDNHHPCQYVFTIIEATI